MYEIEEKIVGDKKVIFVRKKEIPKEFGWVVALKEIMKKGYKIKAYYTIQGVKVVEDNLKYWEYDPEMKGMAPVVPDKIEVYKESYNPVEGKKLELVGVVMDRKTILDPDPAQTVMLWDLING